MPGQQLPYQTQPLTYSAAPAQGRPVVSYIRPQTTGLAMPQVPQAQGQRLDPMMMALQRRLALNSKTGDMNAAERSVSGKDSQGRPRPEEIYDPGKVKD